jgi:FixJ family two-component response regulator
MKGTLAMHAIEDIPNATILVVDDDPLIRDSLDMLFRSMDFSVQSYGSAQELLAASLPATPACLVMDVRMPKMSGLECGRLLADRGVDIPIIFLTAHGDIPMSVAAMKTGAIDFLTKPVRGQDLLDAVNVGLVHAAERQASNAALRRLQERHDALTTREREVMHGVVRGLMNKQIAHEIGISEITVKLHRGSLMRKMDVRTVPDLVRAAEMLRRACH